jgi:hypothetical protein
VQMWQGGNNDYCWAARVISHLGHLDIVAQNTDPPDVDSAPQPSRGGAQDRPDHSGQLGPPTQAATIQGARCSLRAAHAHIICFAQHFLKLQHGLERQAYHNTPAWQWRAIMELVVGRLQLRYVTAHLSGACRSPSVLCPCCPGRLEDPAYYMLERAGLADIWARYPAVCGCRRCYGFKCGGASRHAGFVQAQPLC